MRLQRISRNWIALLSIVVVGLMVACTCKLPTPVSQAKPTVAILAPANGAEFAVGQAIDVQVAGSAARGVRRLELLVDGGVVDTVSSPDPQPALNATLRWVPDMPGAYALVVLAHDADEASNPASVMVSVVDGQASSSATTPVIQGFAATPLTIEAGGSSTLSWTVADATAVEIDQGVGHVALNGSYDVRPTSTTTYRLTAHGPGGDSWAIVQVTVSEPASGSQKPTIQSFTANPATVDVGGSSTLQWAVTGATSVEIDHGVGAVDPNGSRDVSPASSTTYRLTAHGPGGDSWAIAQVTVKASAPQKPVVQSFTASPATIDPGGSSTLQWAVTGATSVEIDHGVGGVSLSGSQGVSPASTTTYKLTAHGPGGDVSATAQVTVRSAAAPRVTSPNGGERWRHGQEVTIQWTGFAGSRVKIEVYRGSTRVRTIVMIAANNGWCPWTVSTNLEPGTNYRIKITSESNTSQYDYSDNDFTIQAPAATPRVTSPNGGETWRCGWPCYIRWTGFTGSQVKIDLYRGSAWVQTIASATDNDGSRRWVVPSSVDPGSSYRIRIVSTSDPSQSDSSDNTFTITATPRVKDPNGGETWTRGQRYNIRWTGFTGEHVTIGLYRGATMVRSVAASTSNDGLYRWRVPGDLSPGPNYRVKVASLSGTSDFSDDNFTIR